MRRINFGYIILHAKSIGLRLDFAFRHEKSDLCIGSERVRRVGR